MKAGGLLVTTVLLWLISFTTNFGYTGFNIWSISVIGDKTKVRERESVRLRACMCMCVRVIVCMCMCVCGCSLYVFLTLS